MGLISGILIIDSLRVFVDFIESVQGLRSEVALRAGARVLGVNNRNLHTLVLDKNRTAAIAQEGSSSRDL